MYTFELPEIGEGVVEGEIVQWLVQPGDVIAVDTPVCEIMTDKATVEISTPKGGRVVELHGEAGDVIKVHSPLAEIETGDTNGVAAAAPKKAEPAPKKAAPVAPQKAAQKAAPKAAPKAAVTPAPVVAQGKALATPAVRRRARELDIDISTVAGSGKGGRVVHADLDSHGSGAEPVSVPALPQSTAVPSGQEERIKIIGLRRKISEQMVKSRFTAPHFTYVDEVDMTDLDGVRKRLKGQAKDRGVKLTFLPFIMKALCATFRQFPNVNANVEEDPLTLVVKGDINIGIATDTPQGLFVPVIKNVEQKSILQLAAEIADLTERTRAGKVGMDELTGGTFTITSVGRDGGMFATPIINHPEVAILGINRIHDRPVVRDGEIVVRKMIYLSSSFDHRILDGMVAARWTTALKGLLETPESLMLEMV
ncbi:MAG: 2-oxo acid dehydrogenase subunit E2 [Proteobacteria bacterium]|nr:2-oxo acid dehydrogenase subunit E2 [Pseudomonadota bacterium]MCP4922051.1 2-oxo acid dehydrogenase subunit E2 [Pseudomonadota bacterium]